MGRIQLGLDGVCWPAMANVIMIHKRSSFDKRWITVEVNTWAGDIIARELCTYWHSDTCLVSGRWKKNRVHCMVCSPRGTLFLSDVRVNISSRAYKHTQNHTEPCPFMYLRCSFLFYFFPLVAVKFPHHFAIKEARQIFIGLQNVSGLQQKHWKEFLDPPLEPL